MIRPASEIEYPPSEAMCTKARMIARMERIGSGTAGIVNTISRRFEVIDPLQVSEIEAFSEEQKRLLENMKRIIRN